MGALLDVDLYRALQLHRGQIESQHKAKKVNNVRPIKPTDN
jgi:hypothetical protein